MPRKPARGCTTNASAIPVPDRVEAVDVFMARQPIFDRQQNVYGYELLYRAGDERAFQGRNGDTASLSVIMNAMLLFGMGQIGSGKKVFINFTKNLLLNGAALYLPRTGAVIEVLEDVVPDERILSALIELKRRGYTLALDDFILHGNEHNPLLKLVDIIKVDLMSTDSAQRRQISRQCSRNGSVAFLAEKTETREDFEETFDMGYSLFQGYFFSKPILVSRRAIPQHKLIHMQVLKELSKDRLDFDGLQRVIMQDPSITYMLLKYINSAFYGVKHEVTSIKHALNLLGESEIKKWISLTVLVHMAAGHPHELVHSALLRARFCESLGSLFSMDSSKSELFLMGLFSHMDVLVGRPLEEVLEDIPLSHVLKEALLGKKNAMSPVYEVVLSYERGNWHNVVSLASLMKLNQREIPKLYGDSLHWVNRVLTL